MALSLAMHDQHCPRENRTGLGLHSDAAKRVSDEFNLHRVADPYGNVGFWIACRLDDGSSDHILYASKQDAIRGQHHNENYFTFVQIVPANFSECAAEVMLKIARMAYDAGGRMTNGGSRRELIRRLGWEDQIAQSKGIVQNLNYGRR